MTLFKVISLPVCGSANVIDRVVGPSIIFWSDWSKTFLLVTAGPRNISTKVRGGVRTDFRASRRGKVARHVVFIYYGVSCADTNKRTLVDEGSA